jgi:putative hemolysin
MEAAVMRSSSRSLRKARRALVVATGVLAAAAPGAGAAWSVAPGTVPSTTSGLADASCLTASACMLVGFQSGASSSGLSATWDGTAFIGYPTATATAELYGVSCNSSLCMAVGTDYAATPSPHAATWNGSSWSATSAPPTPSGSTFAQLTGVACPAANLCVAVGWYQTATADRPFAEVWNGTSWTLQTLALPPNTNWSKVIDVSCPSTTSCSAVGYVETSGQPRKALILGWNGSTWSVQTSAFPSGANGAQLGGIDCASTSSCAAVGQYEDGSGVTHALAEGLSGGTWSLQTVPDPVSGSAPSLNDVSCSSSSNCEAVGGYTSTTPSAEPLAAGWNGSSWTLQSVPKATGTSDATLYGLSCPTTCLAVGLTTFTGVGVRPLAEFGP